MHYVQSLPVCYYVCVCAFALSPAGRTVESSALPAPSVPTAPRAPTTSPSMYVSHMLTHAVSDHMCIPVWCTLSASDDACRAGTCIVEWTFGDHLCHFSAVHIRAMTPTALHASWVRYVTADASTRAAEATPVQCVGLRVRYQRRLEPATTPARARAP